MDKYALTNCILLDGTEAMQPRKDLAILVDQGKIQAIVPAAAVPKDYPKRDLDGQYVLPGLINLHVHLAGSGKPKKKQSDPVKAVKLVTANGFTKKLGKAMVAGYARQQLLSGVTTIRTVGGILDFDSQLRDQINAGKQIGPRILAGNMAISVPGGHMAGSVAVAAHTIDEALEQLEKGRQQGVDLVKLMITGGVLDAKEKGVPGELKMPPEMVKVVCERAHEMGYTVAAHVESPEGVLPH